MLYTLEQGPIEQKIMQQCLRERLPFPETIANAPDLVFGLEIFFLGFVELTSSRQMAMSAGPIAWKTIHDYCSALRLDEEQSEAMHFHLREMDTAYLEYMRKKENVDTPPVL